MVGWDMVYFGGMEHMGYIMAGCDVMWYIMAGWDGWV